jgi:hypothetical protein
MSLQSDNTAAYGSLARSEWLRKAAIVLVLSDLPGVRKERFVIELQCGGLAAVIIPRTWSPLLSSYGNKPRAL